MDFEPGAASPGKGDPEKEPLIRDRQPPFLIPEKSASLREREPFKRDKPDYTDKSPSMPEQSQKSRNSPSSPGSTTSESADETGDENGKKKKKSKKKKHGVNPEQYAKVVIDTAQTAFNTVAAKLFAAKSAAKKSPWYISIACLVACFGVFWAGLFSFMTNVVTFHEIRAILKAYQVFFALVVTAAECARYWPIFGIRGAIHEWARFLELCSGRGFAQLLTSGLAIAGSSGVIEWLPGVFLLIMGLTNIVVGTSAAIKARRLMHKLRDSSEQYSEADFEKRFTMAQKKFEALDLNGDGQVSRDELKAACTELNINVRDSEFDLIFEQMDRKKKGYIDVSDFEVWWMGEKGESVMM